MIDQNVQDRTPTFWAAPELAKAGYQIFPVKDKAPSVEGGFYAGTTDLSQIAAWIEEGRGDHDVAFAAGLPSNVAVMDADTPEAFEEMRARYGEPTVLTKRGGHWYFRHPKNGKVVSNKVRPGLDRKGEGGLVVMPPSRGRTWTNGIPNPTSLPILPEEFWTKKAERSDAPRLLPDNVKNQAAETIAGYVAKIVPGPDKGRHEHLRHLCGVLLARGVAFGDAEDMLISAWSKVGGELAERAPREVPNTLRTTEQALAEDRATGIPKMEKITPGLFNNLAPVLGWLHEIRIGERKLGDSNPGDSQDLVDLPDPLDFPTDALPPGVGQFIEEAAASVGCPVDFVAVPVLVALSAAIGDTRRVVIKKSWTEGAALYAGIVGEAATKKTPAMNLALRPVRDRQMTLKAEYERALGAHEAALRDHKKASKEGPTESAPPEPPTLGRTYVDDTTVERLADILNENPRGLALTRDELTSWLGSMDQYKSGKGSDRQFYLSVHTNQPIAVDRKSSDRPVIVAHPFVSIIGGIQPAVLPDFGKDRGDGLMERCIFGYPEHQPSRWTEDEVEDETIERYAATVNALYKLDHADAGDGPFPSRVAMTPAAKALFIEEYNALHEEIETPGFPGRLRPAFGKLEAYLARLALILAMTRLHDSNDSNDSKFSNEAVTESDMRGAIKLLKYFKNHARRVYVGLYGDSPSDRLEGDLKDFLESHKGAWEGIASELHEALDSHYKPERPEDLAKVVRAICKRAPRLTLQTLQRTGSRRPFRLTLENAVIADIAVTPSPKEEPPPAWEGAY